MHMPYFKDPFDFEEFKRSELKKIQFELSFTKFR